MARKSTAEMKEHFIDWFLSIPDLDETLVLDENQTVDGFTDETIIALFSGFKAGFDCGQAYSI